jgi:hypothetical protein
MISYPQRARGICEGCCLNRENLSLPGPTERGQRPPYKASREKLPRAAGSRQSGTLPQYLDSGTEDRRVISFAVERVAAWAQFHGGRTFHARGLLVRICPESGVSAFTHPMEYKGVGNSTTERIDG